jgi:hypothetical protein
MKHKILFFIFSIAVIFALGVSGRVSAQIGGKIIDSDGNALQKIIVE